MSSGVKQLTALRCSRHTLDLIRHRHRAGPKHLFVQSVLLQLLEFGIQFIVVDGRADLGTRDGVDDFFAELIALP